MSAPSLACVSTGLPCGLSSGQHAAVVAPALSPQAKPPLPGWEWVP